MGMHVSYHPFALADLHGFYLDGIGREPAIERLALALGLGPDGAAQLKALLSLSGRARTMGMSPGQAHAHNLARVSELLSAGWYTSDCRFSALRALPDFGRYAADWPGAPIGAGDRERFAQDRSAFGSDGVLFLSREALMRLRVDCAEHAALRSRLAGVFRRGWLANFWAAADYAVAHDHGLIEAVNLVRPDVIAPSSLMA